MTANNKKTKKSKMKSSFDPQGSYTGTNIDNEYEVPVQDADDL